MKKNLLTNLLVFLAATTILLSFTFKPDHANFSGEWKLNEGKSELGQFANYATRLIKAEQKDESITISRTAPSFTGGDFTSTENLTYDGKESESKLAGNSTKKATAKWSDDGQSLTIKFTIMFDFNGQTTEVTGSENWTLSDNGKTLVLNTNTSSSFGDFETKGVYEK